MSKLIVKGVSEAYRVLSQDARDAQKVLRQAQDPRFDAPTRVIFLDIDGVLNTTDFLKKRMSTVSSEADLSLLLDEAKVVLLNDIIEKTQAKVVLSSNWRRGRTVCWLSELMQRAGFRGQLIGFTRVLIGPRSNEIRDILDRFSEYILSYVVIDDNELAQVNESRFVWTSAHAGLTRKHADEAISKLLSY